jgi:hypothetical protein
MVVIKIRASAPASPRPTGLSATAVAAGTWTLSDVDKQAVRFSRCSPALSVASRSLSDCPSPVRWLGGGSAPHLRRPRALLPGRFAASYTAGMHCDDDAVTGRAAGVPGRWRETRNMLSSAYIRDWPGVDMKQDWKRVSPFEKP